MAQGSRPKPSAVILGMNCNGLSIARSLGRRGIRVIGIDQDKSLPGIYSRYCRPLHPEFIGAPDSNSSQWVEFLTALGQTFEEPSVLFPCSDAAVLLISRHREVLKTYYRYSLPPAPVTEALINKAATYNVARKLGIPCPNTFTVCGQDELQELAPRLSYPCALKPVYTHLWREQGSFGKLVVVGSQEQLSQAYRQVKERGLEVIVTEIIPGGDERLYALYTYFDHSSKPLVVFTKRKIRQYPIDYGIGSMHISEWEPRVAELGLRLMKGVEFRGIGIPEFKLDPRDSEYKLMEVNVRCGLPIGLAAASGVDIPYLAYQDLIGDPVTPPGMFKEGVKWICFEWDLFAFLDYKACGRLNWLQWIRSLMGKKTYAFFSWDDPIPFLVALKGFIKCLSQRALRRAAKPLRMMIKARIGKAQSEFEAE